MVNKLISLISTEIQSKKYVNKLTIELDEHRVDMFKGNSRFITCLSKVSETRINIQFSIIIVGHIELCDNNITNITIYKDDRSPYSYTENLIEDIEKYIGMKMIL